jgi:hypothetical protein
MAYLCCAQSCSLLWGSGIRLWGFLRYMTASKANCSGGVSKYAGQRLGFGAIGNGDW